ncbi:autotransporter outer membrane beta-barrel domain-containing protein [Martelella limonii]|uniref:autotransporter outer membrane beta-barrel domain-containing protein n=1 Tax=Martelella limonii TaxID=1647649 RepID=UPI00157FC32F|nr:autotransporter outer membrane beta-barrel domain-containing protein [Martelella limonii]
MGNHILPAIEAACSHRGAAPRNMRAMMFASVSAVCLLSSPMAHANGCDESSDPITCTFGSGTVSGNLFLTAASGSYGDDGAAIKVTQDGATQALSITSGTHYSGWTMGSAGAGGDENGGAAGAGGWIEFDNIGGSFNATANVTGGYNFAPLIRMESIGGSGNQNNNNYKSSGGAGGAGGALTFTSNSGTTYTLNGSANAGSAILYALTIGGAGGNQNSGLTEDQYGGVGGAGGAITFSGDGAGSANVGSSSSRFSGIADGGGFLAESVAGGGGYSNGNAGAGGTISISGMPSVSIYWNATGAGSSGLFGLGGLSVGGGGFNNSKNDASDPGGAGGAGGSVTVESNNDIVLDVAGATPGVSAAMSAQSIGGMGGTGPTKDKPGGNGGAGGAVAIGNSGGAMSIRTAGDYVYGVIGQSIGGQGGDGGDGAALAGQGGGGGFGGNGGSVTVNFSNAGTLTTTGELAAGIVAHSIGGGGGTGGDFVSVLGGQAGNGGNGGDGGNVLVSSDMAITTGGDNAFGVVAQSIAGSGGTGGIDVSTLVSLGGDGAGGGTPGNVTVNYLADITTAGYNALGIIAQSVGGGGGAAGSSSGLVSVGGNAAGTTIANGGTVGVSSTAKISTGGDSSIGILAQSVGGGGGSGGDSLGMAGVGGQGEAGGSGGTVAVSNLGAISTAGDYSPGAVLQSVGGGGGNGGSVLTLSTIASIGLGGMASQGGDGGTICIDNTAQCGELDTSTSQFTAYDPALAAASASGNAAISTLGDFSPGIIAQSVGGGGGNGGSAKNDSVLSFYALQTGGFGGAGGAGGVVSVRQNNLDITTSGAQAAGIIAQSVGGGGGTGGNASYFDASVGFNAAFILGGSGGTGGSGKTVTVDLNNATILTGAILQDGQASIPADSPGIIAQSIGGGGGNGGSTSAKDFLIAAPTGTGVPVAFNYQSAHGGNGGNAGDGGDVDISLDSATRVTTIGDGSHGMLIQSVGGGGGNGGDSSVLSTTLGDKDTVELTASVAFGGGAGNILGDTSLGATNVGYVFKTSGGGNGGALDVVLGNTEAANSTGDATTPIRGATPEATILTYSDASYGMLAQSIGGGGGNGGIGNSNAYSQGGTASLKADIGLGGKGGSGGTGGSVVITEGGDFNIQTQGSGSRGIVGQSIGGGGGTSQGGTLYLAGEAGDYDGRLDVGIGLTGGSGGAGGTISGAINGGVETFGGDADAVVLQSIGGGGGIGGSLGSDASSHKILDLIGNIEDQLGRLTDSGSTYQLTVSVGGKGGEGGAGNAVDLSLGGKVTTVGDWSDGVVLQSIGGGGGQGGSSVATGSAITANVEVGVGGKGGKGGIGGPVQFDLWGDNYIHTYGYGAYGLLAQSIGGGGGQGGDGSDSQTGTLAIGGDGGGTGGSGGAGGAISTLESITPHVVTHGSDAIGIVAQSVGGGGGQGGVGSSASGTRIDSDVMSVTIGGKGGVAGDGGTIDLEFGSGTDIATDGDRSFGLLMQSIGGGGGIGVTGTASGGLDITIGGSGGAAGSGKAITFNMAADDGQGISTSGAGAHALVAQSIGGGGGIGGDATGGILTLLPSYPSGSTGASGDGDVINLALDGALVTTGADSFGILAQSLGGGGGFGGEGAGSGAAGLSSTAASGTGGPITINSAASISATGARSMGIFAQSEGASGNGRVGITLSSDGMVSGGQSNNASAIWVVGGTDNAITLTDTASIQSGAAATGNQYSNNYAVLFSQNGASGSSLTVNNTGTGTVSGSIGGDVQNTDDIAMFVNNGIGGTLSDGYIYDADIVNAGTFEIGRFRQPGTTVVSGNFEQTATGWLIPDIDLNNANADLFRIEGDAALDGTLGLNPISLLPSRSARFLSVAGAESGELTPRDSTLFDYRIDAIGNDRYFRVAGADFTPNLTNDLNRDQHALAGTLQNIWDAGGNDAFGSLFGAFASETDGAPEKYAGTLDELRPRAAFATAVEQSFEMLEFGSSLMSCPEFEGDSVTVEEGSCAWASVSGSNDRRASVANAASYDLDTFTFQFGGQKEFTPGWFLGGSIAYQQSWLSQDSGSVSGDGDAGYAGVSLKHEVGGWTFAGALAASYGSYDIDRAINIPYVNEVVSSSPDVAAGSFTGRISRMIDADTFYLKPYVDLDAVYTHQNGYTESGVYGLRIDGNGQWNFAASPNIEIGTRYNFDSGETLRLYGRLGMTVVSGDDWTTSASFTGWQGQSFQTSLDYDNTFATVAAGFQLTTLRNVDLRLEYEGHFSEELTSSAGKLRLSMPF